MGVFSFSPTEGCSAMTDSDNEDVPVEEFPLELAPAEDYEKSLQNAVLTDQPGVVETEEQNPELQQNTNSPLRTSGSLLGAEEEKEYKIYQAKIMEEADAAKVKAKAQQMNEQSKYKSTSSPKDDSAQRKESLNIDSLLRLFKSDFFDSWIGISYLFKYPGSGVHDYLCNRLYAMPDRDIEFYLIELCTMLVYNLFESKALEKFILDKCKMSVHFALQINWLFASSMTGPPNVVARSEFLQSQCEIAPVNGNLDQIQRSSLLVPDHCNESASDLSRMQTEGTLRSYKSGESADVALSRTQSFPEMGTTSGILGGDDSDAIAMRALDKLGRCEYSYQVLHFVEDLGHISDELRTVPVPRRKEALREECDKLNDKLDVGIYLPLWDADAPHYCILRLVAEEMVVLKSRDRVPFILLFEAISTDENSSSESVHKSAQLWSAKVQQIQADMKAEREAQEQHGEDENAVKSVEPKPLPAQSSDMEAESEMERKARYKNSPFGEPFADKQERIRKSSPYGHLPGWHIRSVIIKYGDDCKQEYLALQLIGQFKRIFDDANLPLFLKPYGILVNAPDSGIIETITDCCSIDSLKKFYTTPENPKVSLLDHFRKFYGDPESRDYKLAVRNFVESLAAYSIVAYIMQIKDRHNGNNMIDADGHLIHIDFGFMLTNSPGNINGENVPFKFTPDYMELMGGPDSPSYSYFMGLLRCGYLEVRKHHEKILSLVEIMMIDTTLPCWSGAVNPLESLRERFNLNMTEKQIGDFLTTTAEQSFDCWRTRYYDRFQYMSNGIMY